MEVVDVLFLITVSVYPRQRFIAAFISIQIQALPFVCTAFLNHLHPVPQEGGAVAWFAVTVQPVFFNPPAKRIVDVAVAFSMVQLFDTHFGQAVFGVVVVMLGGTGGLFTGSSAVLVVTVVVSSEMQELVTANQVVVAVVLSVFAVQQVGSGIVLQGFPVRFAAAAFDASGHVVAVIALSLPVVFFACQPVQIVVAVAAVQYDIRQNGILIALYLFALQPAVAVVFELGVQASLSA